MQIFKKKSQITKKPELVATTIRAIKVSRMSDQPWSGHVSADELVTKGEATREQIEHAIEHVNEFYVPVNPAAKTRCVDGRHDPKLDETNLGPQIPGGAPGVALAYRLGVDRDDLTRGTFLDDAERMIAHFVRLGFAPGGHRDEQSSSKDTAGCGAIDGMDKILAAMADPKLIDDHKRIVKTLLGSEFIRDDYLRVLGAALVVDSRSEEYFRNREQIISILEERYANSIATLSGTHHEALVVVNTVPGTTFSSNRFAEKYGFQAFGYDLWYSKQIVESVLPLPSQELDRQRFLMARIMSAISTFMVLTDGSQSLVVRTIDK